MSIPFYNFLHRYYHRRYHGIYRHAKKLFVFDLALLGLGLLMLCMSIFFFLWKPGIQDQIDISLRLDNRRIKSGENVSLSVTLTNKSKLALRNSTLSLRLPTGFIISNPQSSSSTVIKFEKIEPGEDKNITISGELWANADEEERIVATFTYFAGDNKESEQKISSLNLHLPESVIKMEITGGDTGFAGDKFPFTLTLKNQTEKEINNLALTYRGVEKINFNVADKNFSLAPGEEKKIQGELMLPAKESRLPISIDVGRLISQHFIVQANIKKEIAIIYPHFSLNAKFDPSLHYAEAGQTIPLHVSVSNLNSYPLKNIDIRLVPNVSIIDTKTTSRGSNLKADGQDIIVDSSVHTALANLAPQETVEFDINLKIKKEFSIGDNENATFTITPYLETIFPGVATTRFSQAGQPAKLALATQVALNAEVRYYTPDGEFLGSGPLPPQVGETTKYGVIIHLNNGSNNLSAASLKIKLAPNTSLGEQQSVTLGPLFSHQGDSLVWNYSKIPANSTVGFYFRITATPTNEDLGKKLPLIGEINFSATDQYTGKIFNISLPPLDNTLKADDHGSIKSPLVIPQT